MRVCLTCNEEVKEDFECSSCTNKPEKVNGFAVFASDLMSDNDYFNSIMLENFSKAEKTNFWLQSRKNLVIDLIKKYCKDKSSFFEIGCGTGYILSEIEQLFPEFETYGTDIYLQSMEFAKEQTQRTELFQLDACKMPFKKHFDIVGMFDVLEHIEEDKLVMQQVNQAMNPEGIFLVIVPQHKFLWSKSDEYSNHVRRYERTELKSKLEESGFELIKVTSFISSLLPLMVVARALKKFSNKGEDINDELNLNPILNWIFMRALDIERFLIRNGFDFKLGGSLVAVARRK